MEFLRKIKNIIKWLPILWQQDNTKYTYSVSLFKEQLINMANEFEIKGYLYGYHRIETIIKLMDKVYNYEYANEYYTTLARPYGDFTKSFEKQPNGTIKMTVNWKREYTESELAQLQIIHQKSFELSAEKQKRAHKLLWELIEHNIQKWAI
jgi:hypothetical protein